MKRNTIKTSINFTKDTVSLNKNFQKKKIQITPITTANKNSNIPIVDAQSKEIANSPRSLNRINMLFIECIIKKRIISKIISNGVLIIFIL
jgi:hypothetical protein